MLAGTFWDGGAITLAQAVAGDAVDLALDEWGVWSDDIDIPALYARQTHHRAFGGYVYGVVDANRPWACRSACSLSLSLAGYGLTPRPQLRASDLRQRRADRPSERLSRPFCRCQNSMTVFTSHGVELNDIDYAGGPYPVLSVMDDPSRSWPTTTGLL